MDNIFEVIDKSGRKIRLSKEGWKHIKKEHPQIQIKDIKQIKHTIIYPLKIKLSKYNMNVNFYYTFNKERKRYLMVCVKYLNGEGFIITAYYMKNIR